MLEINTLTWILVSAIALFTFLKWYVARNDDYWRKRGIPYQPRMSFLAFHRMLKREGMASFIKSFYQNNLRRVYGGFEGTEPIVVVSEPDLLRDILVKDIHIFPYRRLFEIGDPVGDNGLTNLTGEQWKRIRTIITPAFTSKRMRQMGSIINDCSKTVLEVCEKRNEEGNPVECKSLFGAFTMDVIANSAFGTHIDSHNDPNNEFVRRARRVFEGFNFALIFLAMAIPSWIWKCLPSNIHPQKFDRNDFFRDVTRNVIKKRKETGRRYNDFLQILMDAADETRHAEHLDLAEDETDRFGSIINGGLSPHLKYNKLSETELLAQCVLFFIVGYETTASMLTFIAYSLATNPDWQEKLIKEVDETFQKHEEMSYDAVREMKILDAIVSETLRMYPPLALLERTAVENYELRNTGIVIEKGMRVMIPIYGMHYDPEFFEDPETFNPERFLEDPKHPQYAYMPFGSGPRNCIGMRFALLEIKVCLSNLLRHFRLKPHSNTKIPLDYRKDALFLTVAELPLLVEKRTDVKRTVKKISFIKKQV